MSMSKHSTLMGVIGISGALVGLVAGFVAAVVVAEEPWQQPIGAFLGFFVGGILPSRLFRYLVRAQCPECGRPTSSGFRSARQYTEYTCSSCGYVALYAAFFGKIG